MDTYTIGEVAEQSGFSTSALRYYESVGLVAPAARSDAGYRLYDARTLVLLSFIARAKQLGCSLDEIGDLIGVWDGERCGPVQQRLHTLVTAKIAAAQRQISELRGLATQLQDAAAQLGGPATDGPCGADCACLAPYGRVAEQAEPPIVCTLEPDERPGRFESWRAMLALARSRTTTSDGALRVQFAAGLDVGELARLAAAEQRCCSFFSFAITVDDRGVALEVRAPDDATDVVASLFA